MSEEEDSYKKYRDSQGHADRVYKQHGIDLTRLMGCPYCDEKDYEIVEKGRARGQGDSGWDIHLKCNKCGAVTTWSDHYDKFDQEKYNQRPREITLADAVRELQKNDGDLFCKILVEVIAARADAAIVANKEYTGHYTLAAVKTLAKEHKALKEKVRYTSVPITEIHEEMEALKEKQLMLTWLNGRASELRVFHDEEIVRVWDPMDATSIEDMIAAFCERHGIDMAKEVGEAP